MRNIRLGWFIILLFVVGVVVSCVPVIQPASQFDLTTLVPYQTSTLEIQPTLTPEITQTPAPTPTIQIYIIQENDNLTSIAQKFSISLEAILSANPDLIPEALVIGETISIPSKDTRSGLGVSSTLVPLEIGQGNCYVSVDGTTCILIVRNPGQQDITNLMIEITLLDNDLNDLVSQDETIPIDILPAGTALPIAARFANVSGNSTRWQLLSASVIDRTKTKYQILAPDNLRIVKTWDGMSANVSGSVNLPDTIKTGTIKILAIPKDRNGLFIGFNRKDFDIKEGSDPSFKFELSAYSPGSVIDNIDVIIEYSP